MYETLVCPRFPGYSIQELFYEMFQSNLAKRSLQSNKDGKLWKLNKIKSVSFSHSTLHANEPCDHQEGYCNLSQWYLITEPFAQTADILTWETLLVCFRFFLVYYIQSKFLTNKTQAKQTEVKTANHLLFSSLSSFEALHCLQDNLTIGDKACAYVYVLSY